VAEAVDAAKTKRQDKMEALLAEGQSVLSPSYWGAKDQAKTAA
jgi:hypothetical protein